MRLIFRTPRISPKVTSACIAALLPAFSLNLNSAHAESTIVPSSTPTGVQEIAPDKKSQLLVVLLYDDSCIISCTVVKPLIRELVSQHRVQYEELNTSPKELKATLARAKQLKLETFVLDRTEEVPVVAIFSTKGKRLKELAGRKTREVYKEAIEKALEKVKN